MSRIAEAQRKAGRIIAADAEAAWEAARAHAETAGTASEDPIARFTMHPPSRETREPRLVPRFAPPAQAAGSDPRSRLDEAECGALVRRLFDAPPVGAAARGVMFCRDTASRNPLVAKVAERLAIACPSARVAVVGIDAEQEPLRRPIASTVHVFALSAADGHRRHAELKEAFDFVLFDAQLVTADPDLLALASRLDGVAVIIAEDATRRDRAKAMVEILQRSSTRILGAVLTNRSYPIPQGLYERL